MAAHGVARAGAVAVVVVILRTPAKDAGEDEQRGECEQPEDGSAVVARAQRQADGDEQGNAEPVG